MNDCGHRAVISEQNFLPSSPPLGQFTFTEKKLGYKESEPAVSVNSSHTHTHTHTRQALTSFYISLTVHLGTILVNNQPDALFYVYLFISLLYMFRGTQCSSSGELIVSIHNLIYITLCRYAWYAGPSGSAYQAVTYTE
jgi:hypothetical protein